MFALGMSYRDIRGHHHCRDRPADSSLGVVSGAICRFTSSIQIMCVKLFIPRMRLKLYIVSLGDSPRLREHSLMSGGNHNYTFKNGRYSYVLQAY